MNGIYISLLIITVVLIAVILVLSAVVDRVDRLIAKTKAISREINILDNEYQIKLSEKADKADIEREAKAMLNLRNDFGKLGNRLQNIERKENK
jgi:hypothetical protein